MVGVLSSAQRGNTTRSVVDDHATATSWRIELSRWTVPKARLIDFMQECFPIRMCRTALPSSANMAKRASRCSTPSNALLWRGRVEPWGADCSVGWEADLAGEDVTGAETSLWLLETRQR